MDNFDYDYFDDDDNDVDDDVQGVVEDNDDDDLQGDVEVNDVQGDHLVMLRMMMVCRVMLRRMMMMCTMMLVMMCRVLGGEEELPDEGDLDLAIAALARLSSSL